MKVIALHQIYLDYILQRSGVARQANPSHLLGPRAYVRPKAPGEPLFPSPVDKDLFQMRVPFSAASPHIEGEGYYSVREKCLDRLEVDIRLDVPDLQAVKEPATHDRALNAATDAANVFLSHCRVAARSPAVRGIEKHYDLASDRFFVLNPRTVCWHDGVSGDPIPAYEDTKACIASSGSRPLFMTKPIPLDALTRSMTSSEEPPLALSLLADTAWLLRILNLREALLLMGAACEVAAHAYTSGFDPSRVTQADKSVPPLQFRQDGSITFPTTSRVAPFSRPTPTPTKKWSYVQSAQQCRSPRTSFLPGQGSKHAPIREQHSSSPPRRSKDWLARTGRHSP
jgi:hypothetical protein